MRIFHCMILLAQFGLFQTGASAENVRLVWDFRPPLVAECHPNAEGKEELRYAFGVMSTKQGDRYVLFKMEGDQFKKLLIFSGKKDSSLAATPFPDDSNSLVKTYLVINGYASNGNRLILLKVDLNRYKDRLFLGMISSVSVVNSPLVSKYSRVSDYGLVPALVSAREYEYDLDCENIYSNDNRYPSLVKTLFGAVRLELD